jgi:hypothetical protein
MVPSGQYMLLLGRYTFLQFWDPIANIWRNVQTGGMAPAFPVTSDGSNFRLANLTGTVVGAVVTNGGTGYTNGIYYPPGYAIPNNPNAVVQAGTAAAPSATVAAGGGTVPSLRSTWLWAARSTPRSRSPRPARTTRRRRPWWYRIRRLAVCRRRPPARSRPARSTP